ncbi:MAG: TonB-dependent receptor domain-containing protein, partial [Acidobacteriaceae bacterium]
SATNRMFARMTDRVRQNDTPACFLCNGADESASNDDHGFQVVFNDTYTPGSTWVINAYGAYTRWWEGQTSIGYGVANASTIGLSPSLFQAPLLPLVSADNYMQLGSTYSSYNRYIRYLSTGIVNVTKQLNTHSIKFGFNFDVNQINIRQDSPGTFSFSRNQTSCDVDQDKGGGPCVASITGSEFTGNGIASMLMGVGNGESDFNMDPAMSLHTIGMYVQDNWRATPRLTVSAGMRYENQRPATERHNRLAYFDKTAVNPLSAAYGSTLLGAFEYAGVDGRGRYAWEPDNLNFAPRLGLAYQVTEKFVVRAGSGIFYGPASAMIGYDNPGEFPGYTSQTYWYGTQDGLGYIPSSNLVSNPYPSGLNPPTGNSLGAMTLVGNGAGQIWPKGPHPIGEIYEWSTDLQYQLSPHSVAELGYTGVRGRRLLFGNPNFDLDQMPDKYLSLGNQLQATVTNPFYGIAPSNTYLGSATQIQYNELLRPYPEYTYLQETRSLPGARSQFDALYAKYNHAFSNGLSAIVTYQWSKNMDDGSEALLGWTINDMWRDATKPKLDYAISTHDVPQSFATAFVYQLPYGDSRKWGGTAPWALRQTLGDWSLAGDIRLASGLPLPNPVQFSYNPIGDYGFPGPGLPSMTGVSPIPAHRSATNWINPAAYEGQGGQACNQQYNGCSPYLFQYGNEPQRYTQLREAPTKNLDLSVSKTFGPPRIRTLFRLDVLNVFNHPIYGGSYNIGNTLDYGDVGEVFGTRNDPRNLQAAVKVMF